MRLDAVRQQLARDFPNEDINVTFENDTAFVRGTVKDVIAADRVMAMTASLGKSVNLLRVEVPPVEQQILLKVRFATWTAAPAPTWASASLRGAFNQTTAIGTGQFSAPERQRRADSVSLSDALNVLLFRRDINLAAAIRRWKASACWKPWPSRTCWRSTARRPASWPAASFRFRWCSRAPSGNVDQHHVPRIRYPPPLPAACHAARHDPTAGGAGSQLARLRQRGDHFRAPRFPALSTRRVQTEVELESGQSFVIAGLLDNQMTETISKIPGLASIPLLGKLFTSKAIIAQQLGTAGDRHAGSGAADSRRAAAARAEHARSPS